MKLLHWLGLENEEIKIKYLAPISPILYGDGDWIDLRSAQKITFHAGEFHIIRLGVAMELPLGYEAHIVPRSSLFKHHGLIQTNGVGIIDSKYCGDDDEWGMSVYATRDTTIEFDERICQFRIYEVMPYIPLISVDSLGNKTRGGFGSTGKF